MKKIAHLLGVTQQIISHHLKVLGMIQKQSNWEPNEKNIDF